MFVPRRGGGNKRRGFYLFCYGVKAHNVNFCTPQSRLSHFAVIKVNSPFAFGQRTTSKSLKEDIPGDFLSTENVSSGGDASRFT